MTVTTINLEKFKIDFGKNGESFYRQNLFHLTDRELGMALGKSDHVTNEKKGLFNAYRFKRLCSSLDLNPKDIISDYQPSIVHAHKYGSRLPCDLKQRDDVIRILCDRL